MHKRTAHRWRLSAIMAVGVAFALGSFWLVQVMHQGDAEGPGGARKDEPDYIVEHFSFVRMTPQGTPRYIISGASLTHLPADDSAEIELPVVRGVTPGQPPTTIHALHAHVRNADSRIDLTGKVDIERTATPQSQYMRVKTEALTIFPDFDTMQSDRAVEMVLGEATVSGIGMKADNAAQRLHLETAGRIVYPPRRNR